MSILLDRDAKANSEPPKWLILHRPSEPQRKSWCAEAAKTADEFVRHGWVMWREGAEVHVKHRAWVHQ